MEDYSMQFFTSLVNELQHLCKQHLKFRHGVEVSGYLSVEIDSVKKERYLISEMINSSGNTVSMVSESFCAKSFTTPQRSQEQNVDEERQNRRKQRRSQENLKPYSQQNTFQKEPNYKHLGIQENTQTSYIDDQSHRSFENYQKGSRFDTAGLNASKTAYSADNSFDDFPADRKPSLSDTVVLPHTATSQESWPTEQSTYSSDTSYTAEPTEEEVIDLDSLEEEDGDVVEMTSSSCATGLSKLPLPLLPDPQQKVNPGSLNVMKSCLKRFKSFHYDRSGRNVDLLSCQPHDLNQLLLDYFKYVKRQDGTPMSVGSLKTTHLYIERYLKQNGYNFSITKDPQFRTSRDCLKFKMEAEKKTPSNTSKAVAVDAEDIEVMFQKQVLGSHNCETVINTLWFFNSKFFGIRGPMEHSNLKWGDINLCITDNGHEYLERIVNTNFSLREFAKPDAPHRCFVNIYKQYKALRPKLTLDEFSPFYLKPAKGAGKGQVYSTEALAYSCFTGLWRKMAVAAKLPSNKKIL